MKLIEKYNNQLAAMIILIAGILIFLQLPKESEYSTHADESNYYRQGKLLVDSGFGGFHKIATDFITDASLHDTPNPLRIGASVFVSLFIRVNNSMRAISVFCMLCYLLLLAGTFVFVNRYWGALWALITMLFIAVSPLEIALARRALMDMPSSAFSALACFCFWPMVTAGKKKYIAGFTVLFLIAISIRETAVLLFPFFLIVLCYMKWKNHTPLSIAAILFAAGAAPFIMALTYLLVYGSHNLIDFLQIMREPSHYNSLWARGPWFQPVIDYVMLSPFIMALAVAFAGYQLLKGNIEPPTAFMLSLGIYVLLSYVPLPKNVRYCLLLDVPLRFMAAGFLVQLYIMLRNKVFVWIVPVLFSLLLVADMRSFYAYFRNYCVYDTISFNLLESNHILPPLDDGNNEIDPGKSQSNNAQITKNATQAVMLNPTVSNYGALARAYYSEGKLFESILAYRELLRLDPHNANAYFNLGATYNILKDWDKAIEASANCLKYDSTYEVARENLDYAGKMRDGGK
jgi:tetratricopeptide (TPR) repeat protein